jgi:hypothetical protein
MVDGTDEVVRPNVLQWLRYAFVGSVPAKNSAWVLHDATTSTWVLRHIARFLVLVAPIVALVLIFLPAPMSVRVLCCAVGAATMLIFYLGFTVDALERRVEKAGYPYGLAARVREQRALDAQRAVVARNRERRDARLQRHRRA